MVTEADYAVIPYKRTYTCLQALFVDTPELYIKKPLRWSQRFFAIPPL